MKSRGCQPLGEPCCDFKKVIKDQVGVVTQTNTQLLALRFRHSWQ